MIPLLLLLGPYPSHASETPYVSHKHWPAGQVQPPSQQATRHARRIYVGGLPPTANEQNIATFFSNALAAVGGTTAGPGECFILCISVVINI